MSRIILGGATRVIKGVEHFQRLVFGKKESLFKSLEKGQSPLALFITCSDSRINPNLLTQTEPGELFILRSAGNLIPAHGAPPSAEAATIEYALAALDIHDVILCGHSQCGAVKALLHPEAMAALPAVRSWLEQHAAEVAPQVARIAAGFAEDDRLDVAIERNVLVQLEHLRSHPSVQRRLAEGKLRLHAWVYHFETGVVTAHDPAQTRFVPLGAAPQQQFVPQHTPLAAGAASSI
jgi:carbonic anhydrase